MRTRSRSSPLVDEVDEPQERVLDVAAEEVEVGDQRLRVDVGGVGAAAAGPRWRSAPAVRCGDYPTWALPNGVGVGRASPSRSPAGRAAAQSRPPRSIAYGLLVQGRQRSSASTPGVSPPPRSTRPPTPLHGDLEWRLVDDRADLLLALDAGEERHRLALQRPMVTGTTGSGTRATGPGSRQG